MRSDEKIIKLENLMLDGIVYEDTAHFKNSIFRDIYRNAALYVSQIVEGQVKNENSRGNFFSCDYKYYEIKHNIIPSEDYRPYNVISFMGERGTGKTSAMLSFMNALIAFRKGQNDYLNPYILRDINFIGIKYIDISMLKEGEDLVAIILSRMLKYLIEEEEQNRYRNPGNGKQDSEELRMLYQSFDSIYKNLSNLNISNKKYPVEGESGLRTLRKLSSSYLVADEFRKLVKDYMNYVKKNRQNGQGEYYLVIALDDLDLCPLKDSNPFLLLESIYDYLMVPGIIVLTTFNYHFLSTSCTNYWKEKFKFNIGTERLSTEYIEKIIPVHRRIVMPQMERKEQEVEAQFLIQYTAEDVRNQSMYERYLDQTGKVYQVSVKKYILSYLASMTGIMFDGVGQKTHFFEPVTLRELVNLKRLIDSLGDQQLIDSSCTFEEINSRYTRLIDYIFGQYVVDKLNLDEFDLFRKLSMVNIARRSRDLVEYIRMKRSKLDPNDPYYYQNASVQWSYSYGELIYNLYCSTRCGIFSKQMVHCILASYSVVLNQSFLNSKYGDMKGSEISIETSNKLLTDILGTSITGQWANSIVPSVYMKRQDVVTRIDFTYWVNIGSVNIKNVENVLKFTIDRFAMSQIIKGNNTELYKEAASLLHVIETIFMFFTGFSGNKEQEKRLQFRIEDAMTINKDTKIRQEISQLTVTSKTACFNVFNFLINVLTYQDYFNQLHSALLDAIVDYSQIECRDVVTEFILKHSLIYDYQKWERKNRSSMVVPIHQFDMMYNLVKRMATKFSNGSDYQVEKDQFFRVCVEKFAQLGSLLKEQDEFYCSSGMRIDSHMYQVYSSCPYFYHIPDGLLIYSELKDTNCIERYRYIHPYPGELDQFKEWFNYLMNQLIEVSDDRLTRMI